MNKQLPSICLFHDYRIPGPQVPGCVWVDAKYGDEWHRVVSNNGFVAIRFLPHAFSTDAPWCITVNWEEGHLMLDEGGSVTFFQYSRFTGWEKTKTLGGVTMLELPDRGPEIEQITTDLIHGHKFTTQNGTTVDLGSLLISELENETERWTDFVDALCGYFLVQEFKASVYAGANLKLVAEQIARRWAEENVEQVIAVKREESEMDRAECLADQLTSNY